MAAGAAATGAASSFVTCWLAFWQPTSVSKAKHTAIRFMASVLRILSFDWCGKLVHATWMLDPRCFTGPFPSGRSEEFSHRVHSQWNGGPLGLLVCMNNANSVPPGFSHFASCDS